MDISPAVPTPRKGDPITAEWAAQVAAAANSVPHTPQAPGAFSSPYGSATPAPSLAMLGAWRMPLPFDCVLFNDSGATKLCIFLPSGTAPYVYYGGKPLDPAQAQSMGDADSGWVELGSASHGSAHYVYLKWHQDQTTGEVDGWQIEDTSTPESAGTGTVPHKFLLAWYNIPADGNVPSPGADNKFPSGRKGLVQCHRGTVVFCDPAGDVVLDTDAATGDPPGESLNRFIAPEPQPGETPPPDGDGQIQLRQFHDTTDVETVQAIGDTGDAATPANLQTLFRLTGHGTSAERPKLVYVGAEDGPFWVRGGDETMNFGTAINLGDPQIGYITISVTT